MLAILLLAHWHLGSLEHWNAGTLGHRHIGTLAHYFPSTDDGPLGALVCRGRSCSAWSCTLGPSLFPVHTKHYPAYGKGHSAQLHSLRANPFSLPTIPLPYPTTPYPHYHHPPNPCQKRSPNLPLPNLSSDPGNSVSRHARMQLACVALFVRLLSLTLT